MHDLRVDGPLILFRTHVDSIQELCDAVLVFSREPATGSRLQPPSTKTALSSDELS